MIDLLRSLLGKVDRMQEQLWNVSGKMEITRQKLKRNSRGQKYHMRNKECL